MTDSLFFADKCAGLATHSTDAETEGFVEFLARKTAQKLFVCHRLDRDTTGAMVFAKSQEAAARLTELFTQREVKKTYYLLTDRKLSGSHEVVSEISKVGNDFVSNSKSENPNAKTYFKLVRNDEEFSLWEAHPETGKSHQIRLHAEALGIPILGDHEHGGSWFPQLMLHSKSLRAEDFSHESELPLLMQDLKLLHKPLLSNLLIAFDRRLRLERSLPDASTPTVRFVHSEGDPFRCEKLGEVIAANWFSDEAPSSEELEQIEEFLDHIGQTRGSTAPIKELSWYMHQRTNRGARPNEEKVWLSTPPPPERWTALENGVTFEFRRNSGLSPGLFLDQRENRGWVRKNSRQKTVLNLFAYTGGFSVSAALGGATKVVTVDVSKSFLEWAKKNFALNSLDLSTHEFRAMDARDYLAWAAKKNFTFDLIICDPPSFGRSDKGVFRIEKDLPDLILSLTKVLAPEGKILLSTNFEKWTLEDFEEQITKSFEKHHLSHKISATPPPDLDFEIGRSPRNMKSVFLHRN